MIPSDLIERASAVRIEDEIERRGIKLVGWVDRCGPCPQCGGKDRFSINVRKQVFLCRGCAARGNVIALVRFLDGCGFHEALERLTGERLMKAANVALAQHLDEAEAAPSRPAPAATDAPRDDDRDARALMLARQIAFELCPILGSPGETYFRDVRRIDTEAIADVLERIDAIGWHPAVYFNESGHALHGRKLRRDHLHRDGHDHPAEPTGAISRHLHPRRPQARQGEDARLACRDYQAVGRRRRARRPAYRRGPRNRARRHVDRPQAHVGGRLDRSHGEVSGSVRRRGAHRHR